MTATAFLAFSVLVNSSLNKQLTFNMATDLAWGAVAVDNHIKPSLIQVHLKKSINPVQAWTLSWVSRGCLSTQPRPSCITLQSGEPSQAHSSSTQTLSKHQLVTHIRSILQLLGLPQFDYAGHSFHIGVATTTATAVSIGFHDSDLTKVAECSILAINMYSQRAVSSVLYCLG